jgi:hypothetical protein
MKKTLIGIFLATLAFTGQAQGLKKIIVEKYYVSDGTDLTKSGGTLPVGSVTWRIYVEMLPGYVFQQATGDKYHDLVMTTTTKFYNSDLGDFNPNGISTANAKKGTTLLDSWISAGAATKSYWGVLKSDDNGVGTLVNSDGALQNKDTSAGIPLTVQDGLLLAGSSGVPPVNTISTLGIPDAMLGVLGDGSANGNSFSVSDGAWYFLGGVAGPDTTNRVLIAQITTDGTFHYELNIQLGKNLGNGQSLTEKYAAMNPQADEMSGSKYNLSGTLTPIVGPLLCSITSPASESSFTVGDTIPVTVNSTCSACSVVKVELFADNQSIGVDSTSPYTFDYIGALGTHTLKAEATDNYDKKVTSEQVIINLIATGIKDINNGSTYLIYPNPASDLVTLDITSSKQFNKVGYKIINMEGKVLIQNVTGTNTGRYSENININSLAKGQYTLQITVDDQIINREIIKQ